MIIKKGFTLVEVVVAAAIIMLFISALASAYGFYIKTLPGRVAHVQAAFLAGEGVESVKQLRNEGWSDNIKDLSTGTDYYLMFSGGVWAITADTQTIDDTFVRTVRLDTAYRDGNSDIALHGTADSDTRKLTVTVNWNGGVDHEVLTTYITNLFDN